MRKCCAQPNTRAHGNSNKIDQKKQKQRSEKLQVTWARNKAALKA